MSPSEKQILVRELREQRYPTELLLGAGRGESIGYSPKTGGNLRFFSSRNKQCPRGKGTKEEV